MTHESFRSVLVLAPEPWSLDGSLGDQAMLMVAREALARHDCHLLTFTASSADRAHALGYVPIAAETIEFDIECLLDAVRPEVVVVIGADVIDGSYGPHYPLRMLACLDAAAARGLGAVILGSSFSRSPHPSVVERLRDLDPRVAVCMRDELSLERLEVATGRRAELVADLAFLLRPRTSAAAARLIDWSASFEPRAVIGFNIHRALFATANDANAFLHDLAPFFVELTRDRGIAWVLIPHDVRPEWGDVAILWEFERTLRRQIDAWVWPFDERLTSGEVKSLVACCDGVVSGRMHLAIAALGQNVPVLCMTYKDKFEGLLKHFELTEASLIDRVDRFAAADLSKRIVEFVDRLDVERELITSKSPAVLALARKNIEFVSAALSTPVAPA